MKFKKLFYLWGSVVGWCGVIFAFSSMPTLAKVPIIWWDFVLKKGAHMVEYGILFFLLFRAFKQTFSVKKFDLAFWTMIFMFCMFYALSDEWHQSFVPGRTSTIRDVGFDFFGMLSAFLILKKCSVSSLQLPVARKKKIGNWKQEAGN